MQSLAVATRLIRPFTLMFSRSLGVKNVWPKVLYLSQASTGQWLTTCTISSFSSLHSRQSCRSVGPSLNTRVLRVGQPANSSTDTLSLCSVQQRFTHQGLGLATTFTIFHLFRCAWLKWLLMTVVCNLKHKYIRYLDVSPKHNFPAQFTIRRLKLRIKRTWSVGSCGSISGLEENDHLIRMT